MVLPGNSDALFYRTRPNSVSFLVEWRVRNHRSRRYRATEFEAVSAVQTIRIKAAIQPLANAA
jgi:hypothetical protein